MEPKKPKEAQKKKSESSKGSASGRNKDKCTRYKGQGRHEKSKIRHLVKHVLSQPGDTEAKLHLKGYIAQEGVYLKAGGPLIRKATEVCG